MSVRMIVAAMLVVCVDPVEAGAGESMGMSPAKAETERTHVNAIAITKRFIGFSPLDLRDAKTRTTKQNRAVSGSSCKV